MFLIKSGNTGPRVIMIQGILRELGADLSIDGSFGPKTAEAVRAFQRRSDIRLTADGQVGISTWQAIERITGYRVINIVDAEDPAQRERVTAGLNRAGARDVITMWGQCNAIASAVGQALDLAGASGVCAMVRFYSHGGEGAQNVAAGHDGTMFEHQAGFTAAMMPQLSGTFSQLGDILAAFGCVDLMGCSVGGGTNGALLMQRMADSVRRPAEGGTKTQYSQNEGYIPFNFEGRVRVAYPGGVSAREWGQHVQAQIKRRPRGPS